MRKKIKPDNQAIKENVMSMSNYSNQPQSKPETKPLKKESPKANWKSAYQNYLEKQKATGKVVPSL